MRYVRFVMSKGEPITIPEDEAKRVLVSDEQIVPIKKDGQWTGEVINKAHIVQTIVDRIEPEKRVLLPYQTKETGWKSARQAADRVRENLKKQGWFKETKQNA